MNLDRLLIKMCKLTDFARQLKELSTCKRNKVGAIVFPPDCTAIWAIGYNGPARYLPNDMCMGTAVQTCDCAHAEANAVARLMSFYACGILFSTVAPCVTCANMIINCNVIRAVIFDSPYRDPQGQTMLREAGIPVIAFRDLGERLSVIANLRYDHV